ncbi:MAG: FprA family A-type flavoprotein [Chloroflexi bacterium]|jgi:anaerobic nitric oxide reductase flavorubredoxin|nr:FprA family A-type flavoprotein [Anaerolineaceae bacterium]NMB89462.1 FprA family A-type flavoprotein [Chloroflexota bacterium]
MLPVELRPHIYWVGVNDRTTQLFEGLWSIQEEGISYNSYLIDDEKKAIIDLSSKMTTDELVAQIRTVMDPAQLDYIVINHMEPDHSGALKALLLLAPQVVLLGTAKTQQMLERFYGITENVHVVSDGERLCLGEHSLRFVATPFVHWPETMMTYEESQHILFSCDGFGGYGALNGRIFDDDIQPLDWYEAQSLRYFVNIIATFSKPVRNAIAKLEGLPLDIVAPSHGLVWRKRPQHIIDLYRRWAAYATGPGDLSVTLIYASMYGNTEKMMEVIAQGILDQDVPLTVFNVATTPLSHILPALWTGHGVMVGAPTYEGGLFPPMAKTLEMAEIKHIYNKLAARFGSHAWNGGAQRRFEQMAETLKWQLTGNFEFSGAPSQDELLRGRQFGSELACQVRLALQNRGEIPRSVPLN